jgi:hypothetical protein
MVNSAGWLHEWRAGAAFHGRGTRAWIIFDEEHVGYFNVFFVFFIG